MEILAFLILPFIASLILTGIHSYLGVHVVERGVIFVDLALAQIAALGATDDVSYRDRRVDFMNRFTRHHKRHSWLRDGAARTDSHETSSQHRTFARR